MKPNAEIRRLISELGLRYRPSVQADLAEHAALLGLLARDLAELDQRDLAVAIDEHVRQSPFMPKACELIELAASAERSRIWREQQKMPALPGPCLPSAQELFDAWLSRLQYETVMQWEIDEKPDQWRRIAVERGHLRRLVDGTFIQRRKA